MLLPSLLIYGYATGTHSSRKIERATHDSLASRLIACDQHPDQDTFASFQRRFGEQFADVFTQGLQGSAHEHRGAAVLQEWEVTPLETVIGAAGRRRWNWPR